jgi:hypothetical protein
MPKGGKERKSSAKSGSNAGSKSERGAIGKKQRHSSEGAGKGGSGGPKSQHGVKQGGPAEDLIPTQVQHPQQGGHTSHKPIAGTKVSNIENLSTQVHFVDPDSKKR